MQVQAKPAETLEAGDSVFVIDEHGDEILWTVEVVDVDTVEGIVWVDFDKGQDTFATGHDVDYIKL